MCVTILPQQLKLLDLQWQIPEAEEQQKGNIGFANKTIHVRKQGQMGWWVCAWNEQQRPFFHPVPRTEGQVAGGLCVKQVNASRPVCRALVACNTPHYKYTFSLG